MFSLQPLLFVNAVAAIETLRGQDCRDLSCSTFALYALDFVSDAD